MTMKLIAAKKAATGYRFLVQLDTAKPWKDAQGNPIPENTLAAEWGLTPPKGRTVAQYKADIVREVKLLAREKARAQGTGTALADEGTTF